MIPDKMTDEDRAELSRLNENVRRAMRERAEWLDAKMLEYSKLKPGDDIYNVTEGHKVGVVRELYRYHARQNPLYDTSLDWHYTYMTSVGGRNVSLDNTSRQYACRFGTREDAIKAAKRRMEII